MTTQPEPTPQTPQYDVRALMGQTDRVLLVLDDEVYTLRLTRNGKLILTK